MFPGYRLLLIALLRGSWCFQGPELNWQDETFQVNTASTGGTGLLRKLRRQGRAPLDSSGSPVLTSREYRYSKLKLAKG